MKRLLAGIATCTGVAATLLCAAAASADYTFTVPVSVSTVNGAAPPTITVTCAIAVERTKLAYNTGTGGIVGGLKNVAGGDLSGSAQVNLSPQGSVFTGTATVRVSGNLPAGTGNSGPGSGSAAVPAPPTYLCAASAGSTAYYTTPPTVSGNLPTR